MSLLDIHLLGDPVLRRETTVVSVVTDELRRLIDDMFETMYGAKGIGLAAPQVGRLERVAVVDVDDEPIALVNPEVIATGAVSSKAEEGCLSIPEIYGDVERPTTITLRALDRVGQPFELEADGLLARCLQHEVDHLHGKIFLDYLSLLKRRSALAKWERERAKYPSLRRTVSARDLADLHNEEAL